MTFFRRKKRLLTGWILIFTTLWYFTLGFLSLGIKDPTVPEAKAASLTWVGGASGLWETAANWSGNAVPTSADDVTISSTTGNISVRLSSSQTASFASLTVGGDSTYYATVTLYGNLGTAASTTISNRGVLAQQNTATQTLTGNLTVGSGGILTHTTNTTAQSNELDFSVANLNIQSGGAINVNGKGYSGTNGPTLGAGVGNNCAGGGGAHGGSGGSSQIYASCLSSGGFAYGNVTNPTTIGAGGNGRSGSLAGTGSQGGGLALLNITGTITINGTITANGVAGNGSNGGYGDGGGAGGAVNITAGTIAGTPTSISATGGAGQNDTADGGGGGGGLVFVTYTTDASSSGITNGSSISVSGGSGNSGQSGGAGLALVKTGSTNGTLFAKGNSAKGATSTPQVASTLTVDAMTMSASSTYFVRSGQTLTLNGSTALTSGDGTSVLIIDGGATFTPPAAFTLDQTTLEFHQAATWTNSGSTALTIGTSGVLDMRDFTTATTLTFTSTTVQSTARITHASSTSAQSHIINLTMGNLTINSGGVLDADGMGYTGTNGATGGAGSGGNCAGGGGAHGGNGGASETSGGCTSSGGTAYGNTSNLVTIGSGGNGRNGAIAGAGSAGGGLIIVNVTSTLTINGAITADGVAGTGTNGGYGDGGGAGGGIKIIAGTIAGSLQSITATGGAGKNDSVDGGGGGGGRVYVSYTTSTSITSSDISVAGGTSSSGTAGSSGDKILNSLPTGPTNLLANATSAATTSTNPMYLTTTTPFFSAIYRDADTADTSTAARIQVSTSSNFSLITHWDSGSTTIANCLVGARCDDIKYNNFGTAPSTTLALDDDSDETSQTIYYWRIKFFDNGKGEGVFSTTSAFFSLLDTPNEPTSLVTSSLTASAATLSWSDNSVVEDSQTFQVSEDGGVSFATISSTAANTASLTTSTLSANTRYIFRVRAVNTVGNSAYATSSVIYTLPNVPSSLTASANGSMTQIKVSWSANSNPSTTLYYAVDNNNSGRNSDWISDTTYTFTGLSGGTTYTFKVKAKSSDNGASDYSSTVSAATVGGGGGGAPSSPAPTPPPPPPAPASSPVSEDELKEFAPTGLIKFVPSGGTEFDLMAAAEIKPPYKIDGYNKVKGLYGEGNELDLQYPFSLDFSLSLDKAPLDPKAPPQRSLYSKHNAYSLGYSSANDQVTKKGMCFFVYGGSSVCDKQSPKVGTNYKYQVAWDGTTLNLLEGEKKLDSVNMPLMPVSDYPLAIGGSLTPLKNNQFATAYYPFTLSALHLKKNVDIVLYTNTTTVNLQVDSSYAELVALKESHGAPKADFSGAALEKPKASAVWKLAGEDGKKCVNARFKGTGKKQFTFDTYTCIVLDRVAPPANYEVEPGPEETGGKGPHLYGFTEPKAKVVITREPKKVGAAALAALRSSQLTPGIIRVAADKMTFYATADDEGAWSYNMPVIFSADDSKFSVQTTDLAGNVSPVVTEPGLPENKPGAPVGPGGGEEPEAAPEQEPEAEPETEPEAAPEESPEVAPEEEPAVQPEEEPEAAPEEEAPAQPEEEASAEEEQPVEEETKPEEEVAPTEEETVVEVVAEAIEAAVEQIQEVIETVQETAAELIEPVAAAAVTAGRAVKAFADNPKVEKANERVVAPVLVMAAVANVATAGQLPAFLVYLQYVFGQPLMLLRRRKQKSWGVVYNSLSKLPVDLATLRLVDDETKKVVRSQVTDMNGRYFLTAPDGRYRLEVIKPGFVGLSNYLKNVSEDSRYINLYHGDAFSPAKSEDAITFNIPLDPEGAFRSAAQILKENTKQAVGHAFSVVGFSASVVSFGISPKPWVGALIALHAFVYGAFRYIAHRKKPSAWGTVRSAADSKPVAGVVVRVFDAEYNKLVNTEVTDRRGRYAVLVGPSRYFVTFEKSGFKREQSPVLDYSEEETHGLGSLITRSAVLTPGENEAVKSEAEEEGEGEIKSAVEGEKVGLGDEPVANEPALTEVEKATETAAANEALVGQNQVMPVPVFIAVPVPVESRRPKSNKFRPLPLETKTKKTKPAAPRGVKPRSDDWRVGR